MKPKMATSLWGPTKLRARVCGGVVVVVVVVVGGGDHTGTNWVESQEVGNRCCGPLACAPP
jgi:hypothetical protein